MRVICESLRADARANVFAIPWSRRLEDRPNFGLLRKGRRWEMTWREDQERFVALGALFKLI